MNANKKTNESLKAVKLGIVIVLKQLEYQS